MKIYSQFVKELQSLQYVYLKLFKLNLYMTSDELLDFILTIIDLIDYILNRQYMMAMVDIFKLIILIEIKTNLLNRINNKVNRSEYYERNNFNRHRNWRKNSD